MKRVANMTLGLLAAALVFVPLGDMTSMALGAGGILVSGPRRESSAPRPVVPYSAGTAYATAEAPSSYPNRYRCGSDSFNCR